MCARTFALIVKTTLFEAKCFTFFKNLQKAGIIAFHPSLATIMNIAKMDEKKKTSVKATT